MQGFKKFLLRGNVIELATAVVIGAAFTAIVTAFTQAIVDPLLGMVAGADSLAEIEVGPFRIGLLIAATLNFVTVAAVVYFALILPMTKLKEHHDRRLGVQPEAPPETDLDVLRDIRELLRAHETTAHGADAGPSAPPAEPRR